LTNVSVCTEPTRLTKPLGLLNQVPAMLQVTVGMSPLLVGS